MPRNRRKRLLDLRRIHELRHRMQRNAIQHADGLGHLVGAFPERGRSIVQQPVQGSEGRAVYHPMTPFGVRVGYFEGGQQLIQNRSLIFPKIPLAIIAPPPYSLISISTPAGRSRRIKASTVFAVGSRMSFTRASFIPKLQDHFA